MTDTAPDHLNTVLTVILPALDAEETIIDQLDALDDQEDPGVPWELVVVDNGSTDGTASIVDRYTSMRPSWRRVVADREPNLAYARNVGVREAQGRYLAFCDADDVVAGDWAKAVVRALDQDPLIAFAFEYERLNDPHMLQGRARFQSAAVESFFGLPVASGALGVHKAVWDAVGGNDERWSFSGEDYDFCLRVGRDLGIAPSFATHAVYHVRLRGDERDTFRQARRYGRSHVVLYSRYVTDRAPASERLGEAAVAWWWSVSRAPLALAEPSRRMRWARTAGVRAGRLAESLRQREFRP